MRGEKRLQNRAKTVAQILPYQTSALYDVDEEK
jgi:hypothetical protein